MLKEAVKLLIEIIKDIVHWFTKDFKDELIYRPYTPNKLGGNNRGTNNNE